MANGPMLQQDLFSIMVRFRMWRYVFSADVSKMYRQILISKNDQKWQLIVWRDDASKKLEFYKLNTVTYGTKCASYLAIKSLQSLADIEAVNYPLASEVAKRDFNVEAIQCQQQLQEMMKLGQFELHKWCSNHSGLLNEIPENKRAVSLDINADNAETKALGMKWIPSSDTFSLRYEPNEHSKITKRTILSETAQLFDPLGLASPVIVKAKVFIQELWDKEMDWDEVLAPEDQERWIKYRNQLPEVKDIAVPRHVVIEDAINVQLHTFCDASELAYGAAIYVRSVSTTGEVKVQLLCSKSRVAPAGKMKLSLPRLELCGAAVASDLTNKVQSIIGVEIQDVKYWTDSEIVLSWLYNDISLKTFVANRINHVKRTTKVTDWKHIDFLKKPDSEWPQTKPAFRREPCEEKSVKSILTASKIDDNVVGSINHHNSISRWQRILAYCLKFIQRNPEDNYILGWLSKTHLKQALTKIIKYAQNASFSQDIYWIKEFKPEKTSFKTMTPILDADGVLRVGGRLQEANLTFEQRHPAILPYRHDVTKMIMQKAHVDNMHAGPQALLGIVRQNYWPIKGKIMAKSIVNNCMLCARAKPKLFEQMMSNLPKERVAAGQCFMTTGVDFAGPIVIHYNGRGLKTTKAYICICVCFSTKAVHLEAASDLSMAAFLRCLKRFIARRGIPQRIYSDNAGNFTATNKHLVELTELLKSDQFCSQISKYCGDHNIEWKFIPPRSPHFGGLWESAVKSAKNLLTKVIHNHRLTYEELGTVLAEIESILNSRPLSSMSNDPNDLQSLTAGHFLTGAPLRSINDSILLNSSNFGNDGRRNIYASCNTRKNGETCNQMQKMGTLVILKDPNLPPLQWRIGRITELMPDKDGVVRVAYVKTASGMFTRAIHELAPLPSVEEEESESVPIEAKVKSKLNVEAPEFEWNLAPKNPEKEPINVKGIVKQVKQIQKRKKKVTFAPTDDTPRTTRSGREFGPTKLLAVTILGLLLLAIGGGAQPCNTTKFQNNPGLFFEKMGQLSLKNNAWTIVCHMDMKQYWLQKSTLDILLNHLKTVCPHVHPDEHCAVTQEQLSTQLKKITDRNELILSFSNVKHTKRSPRDTTPEKTFFVERKNGGWLSNIGQAAKEMFREMNPNEAKNWMEAVTIVQQILSLLYKSMDENIYE